jgi:hypothetical protein
MERLPALPLNPQSPSEFPDIRGWTGDLAEDWLRQFNE